MIFFCKHVGHCIRVIEKNLHEEQTMKNQKEKRNCLHHYLRIEAELIEINMRARFQILVHCRTKKNIVDIYQNTNKKDNNRNDCTYVPSKSQQLESLFEKESISLAPPPSFQHQLNLNISFIFIYTVLFHQTSKMNHKFMKQKKWNPINKAVCQNSGLLSQYISSSFLVMICLFFRIWRINGRERRPTRRRSTEKRKEQSS